MKKWICLALCAVMLFALCACGAQTGTPSTPEPVKEWTRAGYFMDENENMLSVTLMEDVDEPGWYVGIMIGDLMAGWTLPQEGNSLHGNLNAWDENAEPLIVTVSEDGEDGLLLAIEGGESYHFKPYDMPEATIVVYVNTEGMGYVGYVEGEDASEIDRDFPGQSAYIGLAEPAMHTFAAWPQAGSVFVKWTKNGEDYSTEPVFSVLLDESAEYVAVFEEDPGWQNPVMNFIGEYQCDRAHALVECFGYDEAWITIEWGGSAWEFARWNIFGRLDTETLTIAYDGANKSIVTVNEDGEESAEDVYTDGTGTITFNYEENSFTWHEDQSDYGMDMVFEWVPVTAESSIANPWADADSAQAAADGAGVGYFTLPEAGMEIDGGLIGWDNYRFMDLLAEANGYVGAAELTVRKGVNRPDHAVGYDTTDVSGDYNTYTHEWTIEAMGWQVHCFGNEDGRTMKAIWSSDNFSYCILVRGQGDYRDIYGLGSDDIAALVGSIE